MVAASVKSTSTADDAFFANILATIDGSPRASEKSAPKPTLQQNLNSLIKRGISFTVKTDASEIAASAEKLTKNDTNYLVSNAKGVLCHLQQMLLCKEIFDQEPKLLEDFKTAISEREGFATEGNKLPREVHEEAVIDVTKFWYADIFKEEL